VAGVGSVKGRQVPVTGLEFAPRKQSKKSLFIKKRTAKDSTPRVKANDVLFSKFSKFVVVVSLHREEAKYGSLGWPEVVELKIQQQMSRHGYKGTPGQGTKYFAKYFV